MTSGTTEYKLVEASLGRLLTDEVNKLLIDGWVLHGGVTHAVTNARGHYEVYAQAMTRTLEQSDLNKRLIETKDYNVCSDLIQASRDGYMGTAKNLIEKGADIETKDYNVCSDLIQASRYGELDVVKQLIEKGADIHAKGHKGYTAVMWASRCGHPDVVNYLIKMGADIDVKDDDGWTPLIHASISGHLGNVKHLVDQGADIEAKDNCGYTASSISSYYGLSDIVTCLESIKNKGINMTHFNAEIIIPKSILEDETVTSNHTMERFLLTALKEYWEVEYGDLGDFPPEDAHPFNGFSGIVFDYIRVGKLNHVENRRKHITHNPDAKPIFENDGTDVVDASDVIGLETDFVFVIKDEDGHYEIDIYGNQWVDEETGTTIHAETPPTILAEYITEDSVAVTVDMHI